MAVPRLLSRGRCSFPLATPSIRVAPSLIPSIRTSISKRGFTASQCSREDIVQTPSRGPEVALTDARARSTSAGSSSEAVMMMVPKRWAKTDIEQILRSKGCTIKRLLMRVDRFTFMNAIMCFVELGSEAEATKAIKELNGFEAQGKSLVVKPLKADFSWEKSEQRKDGAFGSRYFIDEGTAAYDAMRPLLEHRRIVLSVETPGWSTNKRFAVAVQNAETIIERQFGKYGIESVSGMSRFDRGKTHEPNLLCLVDFRTKEGAEKAVNNHHDTQIEGRLTWLRPAQPSSWRIHQIQKVVGPEALKALQESGVVPEGKEVYEDKFANPRPKRQKRQERQ